MEEKKVCTCCENKEPELEELRDEETTEVAGGFRTFIFPCKYCGQRTGNTRICTVCGKKLN